ncbi:MAG TPA: electron transfer flavoprotein subunit beta/FixA family protein [Gammaproteobacteria bacterium]|nr:electron transfer flavoprotein subunit beta/FixA family protein [Gammaproteobacteria bacterium]
MKVLVAIKRVIDFAAMIRVKKDESGVETDNVKMSMNPFDEIAVEEAVRLKEQGIAKEIIVVSIGSHQNQETLRTALAMGADRAFLVETNQDIQPLAAAKILRVITEKESPKIIILGKQAIDSDNNQVGQMLAGLLNWPQGTFASKIMIQDEFAEVTREIDGGLETLKLKLPAVITTDLRLNVPRYLALPNIVQAKRKTISIIPAAELSVDILPRLEIVKVTAPLKRRAGVKVKSVKELIDKLRNEARVIT